MDKYLINFSRYFRAKGSPTPVTAEYFLINKKTSDFKPLSFPYYSYRANHNKNYIAEGIRCEKCNSLSLFKVRKDDLLFSGSLSTSSILDSFFTDEAQNNLTDLEKAFLFNHLYPNDLSCLEKVGLLSELYEISQYALCKYCGQKIKFGFPDNDYCYFHYSKLLDSKKVDLENLKIICNNHLEKKNYYSALRVQNIIKLIEDHG